MFKGNRSIVSDSQQNRHASLTPCESTGRLAESLRQQYLQAMGIQTWYDPSIELTDTEVTAAELTDKNIQADIQSPVAITAETTVQNISAESITAQNIERVETKREDLNNSLISANPFLALTTAIQQCELCELHTTRKHAICGEGDSTADLLIITDAPVSDDSENEVLYLAEDKLMLRTILKAINIKLESVYLTSLVKCQPPEQRAPYTSEMICCDDHLSAQIKILQPKVIIVLGEKASQQLLVSQKTLTDLRLRHHQHLGVPIYASYHPRDLFNSPDNKRNVWQDLLQLKKHLL